MTDSPRFPRAEWVVPKLRAGGSEVRVLAGTPSLCSPPKASACPKEANKTLLNDSSCWTIIGTESVEFSFNTSLACPREPVTPVPLISALEVNSGPEGTRGAGEGALAPEGGS